MVKQGAPSSLVTAINKLWKPLEKNKGGRKLTVKFKPIGADGLIIPQKFKTLAKTSLKSVRGFWSHEGASQPHHIDLSEVPRWILTVTDGRTV